MGVLDFLKGRKRKDEDNLPFIARVDLVKLQKEREKNRTLGEKSILATDFSKFRPHIRLCYVAFEKFICHMGAEKLGTTIGVTSEFALPRGMTMEEACKVVSYLFEKVELENELQPGCEKSVALVSKELAKYGFKKDEFSEVRGHFHTIQEYRPLKGITSTLGSEHEFKPLKEQKGTTDLFTVGGNFKLFKRSDLYERYFEWFTTGVTKDEVKEIYEYACCEMPADLCDDQLINEREV